mgnify:CR=1 FL=1
MISLLKILYTTITASALLLTTATSFAAESDLCIPFKDAAIDKSLIARMLKAADNQHLYRIKSDTSKMGFCVDSTIGLVRGEFKNFNGGIALEGDNSQTMVTIDVGSLDTNQSFIESLLKGDDFFSVDEYPSLIFVSSEFLWLSDKRAVIKGNLSMRGVTKEVAFYVDIIELDADLGDADTILVKATTTVQRSEFGMESLSSMVNDKVNLCMSVEAERYRNPAA